MLSRSTYKKLPILCLLAVSALIAGDVLGWSMHHDFNDGKPGDRVVEMSANGRSIYAGDQAFEGGQSAQLTIRAGETGYGQWGGYFKHPEELKAGDELWFRVRMYFPSGFDYYSYGEGNRLKVLRFHTVNKKTGANEGYNDIYIDQKGSSTPFKYIFEGGGGWYSMGDQSVLPKYDVWETYEFYVKFHPVPAATGGEAIIRFWKNGKLVGESRDKPTLKSLDSVSPRTLLFTYWNGGAPKTQSMWVDDIVLTSDTPSDRDEVGNPFVGVGKVDDVSPPTPPVLEIFK